MTTQRAAFAAVVLLALTAAAWGDGVFIDTTGAQDIFVGPNSHVFQATIGVVPNGSRAGGTGVAGLDSFENHISPVHVVGGDGDNFVATYQTITNPTWDVAKVNTFLGLNGEVKLQGPGSSITLTLTGLLGGPLQTLGPITFDWTGAPTTYDLNYSSIIEQATAGVATETLTVAIKGRARYDADGSPVFAAAPLPGPAFAGMVLMAGIGLWKLRHRDLAGA